MSSVNYDPADFTRVRELFNKAECFVKTVEMHESEISIPAINELRYAGHHLLNSLGSDDREGFDRELRKAESHCQRAMYEASESGILYFLGLVHEFGVDFKDVPITPVVPDYASTLALAKKARDQLGAGRLDRASAEQQAAEYMELFEKLEGKIETLKASRSELNKVKANQVTDRRRFVVGVMIGAVGIAIAIITLVVRLLG